MPTALTPGTLYIVSTPIGNLEDLTYRAARVLAAVDVVAAEDTRHAARLLTHYAITTRRVSLHEHNEATQVPRLLGRLAARGTVAVVSDAGTPLVSDPGRRLTRAALDAGHRVEAVPGASAVTTALVMSGLAADSFTFVGFVPTRSAARRRFYLALADEPRPVIFFEAPHRIRPSLADLHEVVGDRRIAVCREMTKLHETLHAGRVSEILAADVLLKGELTVVLSPAEADRPAMLPAAEALRDEFDRLTTGGMARREAVRTLARRYGRPGREVYRRLEAAKTGRTVDPTGVD